MAVTAALLAALAGCTDGPSEEPPLTAPPTLSATAPAPDETWRSNFDGEQLRAFDTALARWKQYSDLMTRYRREPVDRATVLKANEEYTHSATALTDSYVRNYIEGGVRQVTPPMPLTWTARSIELNDQGGLVEFDQCTDYTTLDLRRDGEPIEGATPENDHAILRVQMASDADGSWRHLSTELVDEPCE